MSYEEEIAWGVQQMLDADLQFPQDVPDTNVVKTNADHIRSMTDEELEEFIYYHKQENCSCCELTETDGACTETLCVNATLRWLKQPYKEDT